jgi:outer membrane protein assembly factor BamB
MQFVASAGKGTAYAVGANGLYAIRAIDGHQLWHVKIPSFGGGGTPFGVAIEGGIIYGVGAYGGKVYAINAKNGDEIWRSPPFRGTLSCIKVQAGVVYLGMDTGIYAIRAGREIWHAPYKAWWGHGPRVVGKLVYNADSSRLRAFRATDGAEVWSFPGYMTAFSAYSDVVYFAASGKAVYALSADHGRKLWELKAKGTGTDVIPYTLRHEDIAYVVDKFAVHALHAKTGREMWRYSVHILPDTPAELTLIGDTLYVADNNLHALRVSDGKERWNLPVEISSVPLIFGGANSSGMIVEGGVAYFAALDHQVYAIYT